MFHVVLEVGGWCVVFFMLWGLVSGFLSCWLAFLLACLDRKHWISKHRDPAKTKSWFRRVAGHLEHPNSTRRGLKRRSATTSKRIEQEEARKRTTRTTKRDNEKRCHTSSLHFSGPEAPWGRTTYQRNSQVDNWQVINDNDNLRT